MAEEETAKSSAGVPTAYSTEAAVLGVCLSEGKPYWSQVLRIAGADGPVSLFHKFEHRLIAEAIEKAIEQTDELHESTVEHYLEPHEETFSVAPRTMLVQLQASTSLANIATLVDASNILLNRRTSRALLTNIEKTKNKILTTDTHPNDISKELSQLSTSHVISREVKTMGQLIDEIDSQPDSDWVVPTGLDELDSMINGGLESGRNYVVAARPKIGKTTVMMNMALNALHSDAVVLLVSLETLERDLINKMIAADGFIDQDSVKKVRKGEMKASDLIEEDREAYEESLEFIKDAPLYNAFPSDLNDGYHTIVSMIASLRSKYGPDREIVVFLDYLQLLVQDQFSSLQELSQYTRDLKLLAMEMGISIVYLSQLSRDGADGRMPQIHHLRGSGTIEQDSDVVLMLNRRSHYDDEAPKHIMDMRIAQSRVGDTGEIELFWQPEKNVVSNLSDAQEWSDDDDEDEDEEND